RHVLYILFFSNVAAATLISTLSLHDALPICPTGSSSRSSPRPSCSGPTSRAPTGWSSSRSSPTPSSSLPTGAPGDRRAASPWSRSEEHTSELQSRENLVCRLLLEKKK